MSNIEGALEDLNKALDIEPKNYLYLYHLGTVYYHIEDYIRAISEFNKVIELKFDFFMLIIQED